MTIAALVMMIKSTKGGGGGSSLQKYARYRIAAQGFTFASIVSGLLISAYFIEREDNKNG